MKNKIYLFGIFLLLVFSACEKDEHEVISIKPEATGVFVDTRDGHEYKWVRLGNLDWMVENLVYGVGDFVEPYYNIDDPDDKQMEDFMFLLDFSPAGIEILNKDLKRGDRVRVIKGPLQGLEGELVRLRGHKRVVIRLEGVASIATSYIPGSFLEKIE